MSRSSRVIRELIEQFEDEWADGTHPDVGAFARDAVGALTSPLACEEFQAFLVALVRVDLEHRWRKWSAEGGETTEFSLESYACRLPELGPITSWPDELIFSEYKDRRRWGDRPDADLFADRFPERRERLLLRLRALDAELDVEAPVRSERWPELDEYEILEELGAGGFGVVYKARQRGLGGFVAIKMLTSAMRRNPKAVARFEDEALAISRLEHDHIIRIRHIGRHEGALYLVLEYLEGGNLGERIKCQPIPADQAAEIAESLADALEAAHEAGIIHRDLKPANILLDRYGRAKLGDFGLARLADAEHTTLLEVLGSPNFMAPEQAAGQSRFVTPAADVYSLGAILYTMLAGRPPFLGTTPAEVLHAVRADLPPTLASLKPGLPRDLVTICAKCLEKEPTARFSTALALRDELHRFRSGEPLTIRPPGAIERLAKWARRKPTLATVYALSGLVALLMVVVLSVVWLWRDADTARSLLDIEKNRAVTARDQARQAEAGERAARRAEIGTRYALNIGLAYQKWREGDLGTALQRLDDCPAELRNWEWRFLYRLCHPESLSIKAHDGEVIAVALSHHRRRLITCGRDGSIKGWDGVTGRLVYSLVRSQGKHPGLRTAVWMQELTDVAVSPNAALIAADVDGNNVKIWDGDTGREQRSISVGSPVTYMALDTISTPRLVANGKIWNPISGALIVSSHPLKKDEESRPISPNLFTKCMSLSSFAPRMAFAGDWFKSSGGVWDTTTGQPIWAFDVPGTGLFGDPKNEVESIAIHPLGHSLAINYGYTDVMIYESQAEPPVVALLRKTKDPSLKDQPQVTESPFKRSKILSGHKDRVLALAFSTATFNGWKLVTGSRDSTAKVWDSSGNVVATLAGHTQPVTAVAFGMPVAFGKDPGWVVTGGADGLVKIWDPTSVPREVSRTFGSNPGLFSDTINAISPDASRVVITGGLHIMESDPSGVYDAHTGEKVITLKRSIHIGYDDEKIAFSPDGGAIAVGGGKESEEDPGTEKVIDIMRGDRRVPMLSLRGHSGRVRLFTFSDDGKRLGSVAEDRTIRVWDSFSGRALRTFQFPNGEIREVRFAPTGRRIAAAWKEGDSVLWDVETGRELQRLRVEALRFLPDGTLAGPEPRDPSRMDWDQVRAREILPEGSHKVVSPDGSRGAVASERIIWVWSRDSGRILFTFKGHTDTINVLKFTQDGSRLVSGSEDGTLRFWDLASGLELLTLRGHEGGVSDVIFSRDGTWLVTTSTNLGNRDGRALVWEAPIVPD